MNLVLEKQKKDQEKVKRRAQSAMGQNKQPVKLEGREAAANSVLLRKSRKKKMWIAVGVGCTILVVAGVVALCVFCPPAGAATTTAVAAEGAIAATTTAVAAEGAAAAGTSAAATAAGTGAAATAATTAAETGAAATAAGTGVAATGAVIVGATAVLVNVGKERDRKTNVH